MFTPSLDSPLGWEDILHHSPLVGGKTPSDFEIIDFFKCTCYLFLVMD